ncbi:MAG: hypothetical protein HXY49_09005 [Ignavibacteriaceae bacterium]|nr:hypothetical protein [Ignavibacteriaceae bacterium]
MEDVVAVFIPIVMFLVAGFVLITYFYLRSKERQMLIEKGLSSEEVKKYFEEKRDGFGLFKIGVISVLFGLGIGLGLMLKDATSKEYWIPLLLFVFTGIGFILANLLSNKMKRTNSQ